jgi:molybdenum cofactor cytidylyltransferase
VLIVNFGAVILAAGKSECIGQNKSLLRLNEKTIIETNLDALTAAGVYEQIVVLGYEPGEVIEVIRPRLGKVKIALDLTYEKGMTSSVQTGFIVLSNVDAAFLILGDHPILDPNLIIQMTQLMESNKDEPLIVSPIHRGTKGHPLLFSKKLFLELLSLQTSQTIYEVVNAHMDKLLTFEAPEWTIMDVDTHQGYARLEGLAKKAKTRLVAAEAWVFRLHWLSLARILTFSQIENLVNGNYNFLAGYQYSIFSYSFKNRNRGAGFLCKFKCGQLITHFTGAFISVICL